MHSVVAKRFEELDAWRLASDCKKEVYRLIDQSRAKFDTEYRDQLKSSAASAPANLAEGFGYYRHPEFARHTRIAKASLNETQNHLKDGVDRKYWTDTECETAYTLADRAIGATVRLLAHLETSDAPGTVPSTKQRKGTTFPKRER